MINSISQYRFDILTLIKEPVARILARELEWYSDENEVVLGTVFLDLTDHDYAFLVLGRDQHSIFRWIDGGASFPSVDEARETLHNHMRAALVSGEDVFPQDDEIRRRKNALLEPVVDIERLHQYFRRLIEEDGYTPAREAIKEIAYVYHDLDGNFIEQFQTTGFDSRMWELYLFPTLHELGFRINYDNAVPDFLVEKGDTEIAIEAVTVNPSQAREEPGFPENPAQIRELVENYMPIKYGSALYTKLQKKYWEKENIEGKPLVFAIHDFHQPASMTWSFTALPIYLYGHRHGHKRDELGNLIIIPEKIEHHEWGSKKIPSGFFFLEGAENVSAVLFSNSATISKFNRMGYLAGFGDKEKIMIRIGACVNPDPNADKPLRFKVNIDDDYDENWTEGLSMYHNPRAIKPIDRRDFPGIAHHFFDEGQLVSYLPEFHPFESVTIIPK